MEKRKNPEKDLKSKQGLLFQLGLLMAMMLCVAAFEYKVEKKIVHVPDLDPDKIEIYLPPITTHKELKPPKPKLKLPDISKVMAAKSEPVEVEPTMKKSEHDSDEINADVIIVDDMPDDPVADEPFVFVEDMPEPEGGMKAFYKYISSNLKYPAKARRMGVSGKVFVQFVVNEKGQLTQLEIIKGIGAGCDDEVIRLLTAAPRWKPGKQRGIPVKVKQVLPISFMMN